MRRRRVARLPAPVAERAPAGEYADRRSDAEDKREKRENDAVGGALDGPCGRTRRVAQRPTDRRPGIRVPVSARVARIGAARLVAGYVGRRAEVVLGADGRLGAVPGYAGCAGVAGGTGIGGRATRPTAPAVSRLPLISLRRGILSGAVDGKLVDDASGAAGLRIAGKSLSC